MYLLTNNGSTFSVRFDLLAWSGPHAWAEYTTINIAPESDKYRLVLGTYSGGTAGMDFA